MCRAPIQIDACTSSHTSTLVNDCHVQRRVAGCVCVGDFNAFPTLSIVGRGVGKSCGSDRGVVISFLPQLVLTCHTSFKQVGGIVAKHGAGCRGGPCGGGGRSRGGTSRCTGR